MAASSASPVRGPAHITNQQNKCIDLSDSLASKELIFLVGSTCEMQLIVNLLRALRVQ